MSLQDIFYIVGIITMTLLTVLFLTLIIVMFYIKSKIGELVYIVEKQISDARNLISQPQKIAYSVGGAIVDTALKKVNNMKKGGKKS